MVSVVDRLRGCTLGMTTCVALFCLHLYSKFTSVQPVILKIKIPFLKNEEQIEIREYLLSFGAEYLIFQFANRKYKD